MWRSSGAAAMAMPRTRRARRTAHTAMTLLVLSAAVLHAHLTSDDGLPSKVARSRSRAWTHVALAAALPLSAEEACVSWRNTANCDGNGRRERRLDKSCSQVIPWGVSGYCECANGVIANRVSCDHHDFTCGAACATAMGLPAPLEVGVGDAGAAAARSTQGSGSGSSTANRGAGSTQACVIDAATGACETAASSHTNARSGLSYAARLETRVAELETTVRTMAADGLAWRALVHEAMTAIVGVQDEQRSLIAAAGTGEFGGGAVQAGPGTPLDALQRVSELSEVVAAVSLEVSRGLLALDADGAVCGVGAQTGVVHEGACKEVAATGTRANRVRRDVHDSICEALDKSIGCNAGAALSEAKHASGGSRSGRSMSSSASGESAARGASTLATKKVDAALDLLRTKIAPTMEDEGRTTAGRGGRTAGGAVGTGKPAPGGGASVGGNAAVDASAVQPAPALSRAEGAKPRGGASARASSEGTVMSTPWVDEGAFELDAAGAANARREMIAARNTMRKMGIRVANELPPPPANTTTLSRLVAVREAFKHAWQGYKQHAWGQDTLKPVSRRADGEFVGMGLTIVDSLDTMLVMGLPDEFIAARRWVADNLNFGRQKDINLFETVIRVLGGLLSAFDLSGDEVFLDRARDLGDVLLFAFDTPTGVPYGTIDLEKKTAYNPTFLKKSSCIAEVATVQVELLYLSAKTGDDRYAAAGDRAMRYVQSKCPADGLLPLLLNPETGKVTDKTVTLGARGDSAYEYLLKQWLVVGERERPKRGWIKSMYDEAVRGVLQHLVQESHPSNLTYIAVRTPQGALRHQMDHLVCFVPGMLVLGLEHMDPGDVASKDEVLRVARGLMHTCFEMYARHPTGLAPEIVTFDSTLGTDFVASRGATHSLLRPETAESLLVMARIDSENAPQYREWGWQIFNSLHKYARVATGGFSGLRDVTMASGGGKDDKMESFFLAETLKYLYLLFSDDSLLPLDRYVFNTEAHPLSILP